MYVAVGFVPTVVDSPGVRRRVTPPTVIDGTGSPVGRTPGADVMLGFAVPCCIGCRLSPGEIWLLLGSEGFGSDSVMTLMISARKPSLIAASDASGPT
jgi:hypothetical protein